MRIKINGDAWILAKLNDYAYAEKHGKSKNYDTQAMTSYNHKYGIREIDFSSSGFTKSTVVHELLHAYLSYRDFSRKSYAQVEEEVCEYLDGKLTRLLKTADRVYKQMR